MLGFMQCIAEAVVAKGVSGLLEMVPGGQYLFDVSADAIKRHRARKAQARLEDEVKELVVARADAALQAANQVAEAAGPQLTPREQALLKQFLASIPDAARQSLRRKEDPSGRSVPAGFHLEIADDLVKILPQHPPRFASGDPLPGLASWRLRERLGGGGFGEVWLASHEWRPDHRAVKFCSDPLSGRRLAEHEKKLIVRVMEHAGDHPNIVPLLECNLDCDSPWLMYEYVPGGTLADLIWEWQTLSSAERFNLIIEALHTLAGAVGHFHRLDIVHRDLKPANILRDSDTGALRITDFGIGGVAADVQIAEHTRGTGRIPTGVQGAYSVLYASPEQRKGEKPTPRDDVHALGVIAYQLLTGDLTDVPGTDIIDELRPKGVPEELISLIGKSVAKPDRRPKDASEWETALKPWRKPLVRRIQITIPGVWRSRPIDEPDTKWTKVAGTPAEIILTGAEVFLLKVSREAKDADLAGLAHLRSLTTLQHLDLGWCEQLTGAGLAHLNNLTALQHLVLSGCSQLTDAGLAHLRSLPTLQYLDLSSCNQLTDKGLIHINSLQNIQYISLSWCKWLTDAGLSHLRGLTSLQHLKLISCDQLIGTGLAHLRSLTALQHLDLRLCEQLTGVGFAYLSDLTALQKLYLCDCNQLTDGNLAHLRSLPALQYLELAGCKQLTDAGLLHICALPALQYLDLDCYDQLTDAGLVYLCSLPALQQLILRGCSQLTDAGLVRLRSLPALRHLNLSECRWLTDTGLAHLCSLSNLQHLNLRGCSQLTNAGLAHLCSLSNLQYLNLTDCKWLTDTGLVYICRISTLQHIVLSNCKQLTDINLLHFRNLATLHRLELWNCIQLTDISLAYICNILTLQHLNLSGCSQLTDAGLAHLHSLTTLQHLKLGSCNQLTHAGVATLRAALPNCEIKWRAAE